MARIEAARASMDDALRNSADGAVLHEAWRTLLQELIREQPPECDRAWMNDRLFDLQLHVFNSPQWRKLIEAAEMAQPRGAGAPGAHRLDAERRQSGL
ncbi:hypothetical protein ACFPOA_00200 [Lysobacter niabensis]|uniref:hypothetical protein n=1 Tax=Agrilutibacter niabensis TaxID=380628 RepID=UPI00360D5C61